MKKFVKWGNEAEDVDREFGSVYSKLSINPRTHTIEVYFDERVVTKEILRRLSIYGFKEESEQKSIGL